jgi:hypothetical protein
MSSAAASSTRLPMFIRPRSVKMVPVESLKPRPPL